MRLGQGRGAGGSSHSRHRPLELLGPLARGDYLATREDAPEYLVRMRTLASAFGVGRSIPFIREDWEGPHPSPGVPRVIWRFHPGTTDDAPTLAPDRRHTPVRRKRTLPWGDAVF